MNPRIVENYDGGDIKLGDSGRVLSPKNFPHLESKKGKTLIVTDGTSLLGGDDKAGAAEILTAVDELIKSGSPHGKICVAFTPDEEIGRGADKFDVERFGAKYAYTVDGGDVTEMEYETFNAAAAVFEVHGFNVHPGAAKDTGWIPVITLIEIPCIRTLSLDLRMTEQMASRCFGTFMNTRCFLA